VFFFFFNQEINFSSNFIDTAGVMEKERETKTAIQTQTAKFYAHPNSPPKPQQKTQTATNRKWTIDRSDARKIRRESEEERNEYERTHSAQSDRPLTPSGGGVVSGDRQHRNQRPTETNETGKKKTKRERESASECHFGVCFARRLIPFFLPFFFDYLFIFFMFCFVDSIKFIIIKNTFFRVFV